MCNVPDGHGVAKNLAQPKLHADVLAFVKSSKICQFGFWIILIKPVPG